ncbi:MAG TPA: hypothetical protein VGD40_13785 [Chryseosolibacter sp.]
MPENAMKAVKVDHVVKTGDIASLLTKLVQETTPTIRTVSQEEKTRIESEIKIAMEANQIQKETAENAELTRYTCPECHGVLSAIKEGNRTRFRCHTGHAFSADSLLSTVTENIEESLWNAIRSIQESIFLLNHMGDHFAENNQPKLAAMYFKKAKDAESRAAIVREAVYNHEQLDAEVIQHQAAHER